VHASEKLDIVLYLVVGKRKKGKGIKSG